MCVGQGDASVADAELPGRPPREGGSPGRVEVPGLVAFVLPVLWDAGLPTAGYYASRIAGAGAHASLLVGTAVAAARVGWVAVRFRRLDALAGFLLVVFGVGVALSFMTGNARTLLAKDSIPTATAGLLFLGTCVAGRPLAYAWGMRLMARTPGQQHLWASRWSSQRAFRRVFYVVSVVWGCGLLVEATVRLLLVYLLPVDSMAALSSVLSIVTVTGLAAWTVGYARWVQR